MIRPGRNYARGHWAKAQKVKKLALLPGPDDDIDAGEAIPEPGPDGPVRTVYPDDDLELPDWLMNGDPPPAEPEPEVAADKPPGRLRDRPSSGRSGKSKVRITATIRKDIEAKIRFVLMPAGQMWAIRDHVCGVTFAQQEPVISEALAEIICDSPDLVAWFTGPAGGFMKYFKLLMALQPVGLAVWAHHIAHAVQFEDGQQPPQQPAYAA